MKLDQKHEAATKKKKKGKWGLSASSGVLQEGNQRGRALELAEEYAVKPNFEIGEGGC